jgi:hypothetical protein
VVPCQGMFHLCSVTSRERIDQSLIRTRSGRLTPSGTFPLSLILGWFVRWR